MSGEYTFFLSFFYSSCFSTYTKGGVAMPTGIEFLMDLNGKQAKEFLGQQERRREYRSRHPTELGALKCMDGRLHLPIATNTPLGIIQPWRNIGGMFDTRWPIFNASLAEWQRYGRCRNKRGLLFVTYHYSRSDNPSLGCAGHKHNLDQARSSALQLTHQCRRVLAHPHYYAILVGFDTDWDCLVLASEDGHDDLDMADVGSDRDLIANWLLRHHADMPSDVVRDATEVLVRNADRAQEIRCSGRTIEQLKHCESVIAVGRGYDWLHLPNKALIVGHFDPDYLQAVITAGRIVWHNLLDGRIRAEDIVLMTSAPYSSPDDRPFKVDKVTGLHEEATAAIRDHVSELWPYLRQVRSVVDIHTRKLEPLEVVQATARRVL